MKSKRAIQFLALAFMAGEVSYVAAEVLVLKSVGPSARRYPAGQRLPDSTTFVLRPGDSVAVLLGSGTRTFRGPGTFSATGPARNTRLASAGPRIGTGAVRGTETAEAHRPADLWQLDITHGGKACIAAGRRPSLWRPVADGEVQLTITPSSGAPTKVTWPSGQHTVEWPAAVPIGDNATYVINWTGATSPTRVTTEMIEPSASGELEQLATAFLANDCRSQMDVLIEQKMLADSAPAASGGGVSQ